MSCSVKLGENAFWLLCQSWITCAGVAMCLCGSLCACTVPCMVPGWAMEPRSAPPPGLRKGQPQLGSQNVSDELGLQEGSQGPLGDAPRVQQQRGLRGRRSVFSETQTGRRRANQGVMPNSAEGEEGEPRRSRHHHQEPTGGSGVQAVAALDVLPISDTQVSIHLW